MIWPHLGIHVYMLTRSITNECGELRLIVFQLYFLQYISNK